MNLKKIFKNSTFLIIIAYLLINLFFNFNQYWKPIFSTDSNSNSVVGEVHVTEWGFEKIYSKIINKENPFSPITDINYPFGIDIIGNDSGAALAYPFIRPFLSSVESVLFIVVFGIFLANLGMYLLLVKLNINKLISFGIAFAYGFMTFIQPRTGHPLYIASLFLLPWFYYMIISFFKSQSITRKIMYTCLASIVYALALWLNSYYFIVMSLSFVLLLLYFLFYERSKLISQISSNWKYMFLFVLVFIFINIPWLIVLYDTFLFSEPPQATGWNGAIEFSSDIFGFLIPSVYNYYYGDIIQKITLKIPFAKGIFEQFTYPGLIIISSYLLLFFLYKKISIKTKRLIKPYLFTSIGFFVLTLGPFLHVSGRWFIELKDGIRLVLPLPFIFLHYVPFLGNIRVPGRLIVGFIFFAYLVVSIIISYYLKNRHKNFKLAFYVLFFFILAIDHRPSNYVESQKIDLPNAIYEKIKKDKDEISVLQIPFVIRDGFTYFGDYNSVFMTLHQSYYEKPTVGVYVGRLPVYIKEYFKEDPLIGYIGRVIDENIIKNPYMKNTDYKSWEQIDINEATNTLDFLSIKYIILDESRIFAPKIQATLESLGFIKRLTQHGYSLWKRQLLEKEYLSFNILEPNSKRYLAMGWYSAEHEFRWADKKSSILFKINNGEKIKLRFKAGSFYKDLKLTIYLNKKRVDELILSPEPMEYIVELDNNIKIGINTIYFIFDKSYKPADVIEGNMDYRSLSGKFYYINILK